MQGISAANAQKRRVTADKKTANNVTKRGMVPDPAADVSKASTKPDGL